MMKRREEKGRTRTRARSEIKVWSTSMLYLAIFQIKDCLFGMLFPTF